MTMKCLLILFTLTFSLTLQGQNYEIKKSKGALFLKNSQGKTLDTIWVKVGNGSGNFRIITYEIKEDSVIVYHFVKGILPDNCPDYYIYRKSYSYSKGTFQKESTVGLIFDNSGCQSYFHEESLYCIHLNQVKINNKILKLAIKDTEGRKLHVKTHLSAFASEENFGRIKKRISTFLLKPECVTISRK